jgi:hypothetical protein
MPSPVKIDLSGGQGPWPAFTVSGVTVVTGMNGAGYELQFPAGAPVWTKPASGGAEASVISGEPGAWSWNYDGDPQFTGDGTWPWTSAWTPTDNAAGTPAFARALAAPSNVELAGASATVAATFATNGAGDNNDLTFTSVLPGRLGNDIRARFVDPNAGNGSLSVHVTDRDITVNLATDSGGDITTTAAQVKAAIEASTPAASLVSVTNKAGNDGSGVIVQAFPYTALTGGTGGLPLPPETVAL